MSGDIVEMAERFMYIAGLIPLAHLFTRNISEMSASCLDVLGFASSAMVYIGRINGKKKHSLADETLTIVRVGASG